MFQIQSPKRSGFTLVEILVVLAILGVLSALLFTVFSRVREKGRSANCQSNLHQIALAMQQYVGDNDGAFPGQFYVVGRDTPQARVVSWRESIAPYIKDAAIFRCPSSQIEPNVQPGYAYNRFDLNQIVRSSNRDPKEDRIIGLHEANFAALSDVVLNMDDSAMAMDGSFFIDGKLIETSCGSQPITDLHSGGANYSYGDGHVKWLSPQQQGVVLCETLAKNRALNTE